MQKAIITGMRGAVGRVLAEYLKEQEVMVVGWNRGEIPVDNEAAIRSYLSHKKPDYLFHLATASQSTGMENESWVVNVLWTELLARVCDELDIKFVFTSSVMVFNDYAIGPFATTTTPNASEGYGYEKYTAEVRVAGVNPNAFIMRLGWQIGTSAGSNNMVDFMETQMRDNGKISASRRWYPATSFIVDTVSTMWQLVQRRPSLYMLDSNRRWTFYEIAEALNHLHGSKWVIEADDSFIYEQRMIDPRVPIPPLIVRLPTLPYG